MTLTWLDFLFISLTACACSWVNAIAGGGILLLYPLLTTYGIPPLVTNVSIKLGLFPGSVGAMIAERKLLAGQLKEIKITIPAAFLGALLGSWIVTEAGEKSFGFIVPYCIIFASLLMLFNKQIKAWLSAKSTRFSSSQYHPVALTLGTGISGIYSGYFGAGNGLIYLGLLSVVFPGNIRNLNALRQITITAGHTASFIFFALGSLADWRIVFFIFLGSLFGGFLGGKTSAMIDPAKLKKIVVTIGLLFGVYLLLKNYGFVPRL